MRQKTITVLHVIYLDGVFFFRCFYQECFFLQRINKRKHNAFRKLRTKYKYTKKQNQRVLRFKVSVSPLNDQINVERQTVLDFHKGVLIFIYPGVGGG